MQYRGTLDSNGQEFESNMSPDKDVYAVTLGQGSVIKGWDQGIPGMKVGGERKLKIPPSLAYGANGRDKIPPNATLDFDIKLLGLVKAGEERVIDIVDKKVGTGPAVKVGDKVKIQYVVKLLNGKVIDDSHNTGAYAFTVGTGQTLSCIDKGVQGMKVGGVREITAPPVTAYIGRNDPRIPMNSEVLVTIELQSIDK
ncbi:MAG TPA: FKBP-type peptidyl-prolyl cis-trans isomerase [Fimbriimonadaceae bacterium]|nr:FKBP-type peptidyl-prolyl cis-trans isomerase [Fimbriimonadaceae bacterium]